MLGYTSSTPETSGCLKQYPFMAGVVAICSPLHKVGGFQPKPPLAVVSIPRKIVATGWLCMSVEGSKRVVRGRARSDGCQQSLG